MHHAHSNYRFAKPFRISLLAIAAFSSVLAMKGCQEEQNTRVTEPDRGKPDLYYEDGEGVWPGQRDGHYYDDGYRDY